MGSTEVTEKNKIIADFDGYEYIPSDTSRPDLKAGWWKKDTDEKWRLKPNYFHSKVNKELYLCRNHNQLRYPNDWNCLMRVIEKIELIDRSKEFPNAWERVTHLFTVKIKDRTCVISPNMWAGEKKTFKKTEDTKLQATFEAVYQFIEWSNKNQK